MRTVAFFVSLAALFVIAACGAAPDDAPQPASDDALAGDSCHNGYYTKPASDGIYYATDFGCSLKADGTKFRDPGDNCIPGCLAQAQQSICAGKSGPDCEYAVSWYVADAARFGCMSRVQVTNPANGKSAVMLVLDYGPACRVEDNVSHPVLDMSYRAVMYLFGEEHGAVDRAKVHVTPVPDATPLGPTSSPPPDAGAPDSGHADAADSGTTPDSGSTNTCPVLAYPSGVHIQTYPSATTTASYTNHLASGETAPTCFLDVTRLDDPIASTRYDINVHVAAHFQLVELVGTEVSQGYGNFVLADPEAVASLERFRVAVGQAVTINSGFRSPKHQEDTCRSLCGDPNGCAGTCANHSRHMWGDAFDLPLAFYTRHDEDLACTAGFKFAYLESGTHLHIDRNPAYATCVEQ